MDEWYDGFSFADYIVPPILEGPSSSPRSSPPSYETPYWWDTINRAIERAAQVATIEVGGYPPYPQYPAQTPIPMQVPAPMPGVAPQTQTGVGGNIQLSNTTLMLLVGGVLLFMLGKRGR